MAASDNEKGMIDLGQSMKSMGEAVPMKGDEVNYPTLHLSDVDELHDLPDGEFYFTAKGRVTRHEDSAPVNGKAHCSCDIAVMGIKITGQPKSKSKSQPDAEERLGDALDTIAKKKADDAEDKADQGADEDTEE